MSEPRLPPSSKPTGDADGERDAWLREALRHAPDAAALPPEALRKAILDEARAATLVGAGSTRGSATANAATGEAGPGDAAARATARRGGVSAGTGVAASIAAFWSWLARPPIAAGFASVMAATLVGVMWWDRPLDDPALPSAAPPLVGGAPAIAGRASAVAALPSPEPYARSDVSNSAARTPAAPAAEAAKPSLTAKLATARPPVSRDAPGSSPIERSKAGPGRDTALDAAPRRSEKREMAEGRSDAPPSQLARADSRALPAAPPALQGAASSMAAAPLAMPGSPSTVAAPPLPMQARPVPAATPVPFPASREADSANALHKDAAPAARPSLGGAVGQADKESDREQAGRRQVRPTPDSVARADMADSAGRNRASTLETASLDPSRPLAPLRAALAREATRWTAERGSGERLVADAPLQAWLAQADAAGRWQSTLAPAPAAAPEESVEARTDSAAAATARLGAAANAARQAELARRPTILTLLRDGRADTTIRLEAGRIVVERLLDGRRTVWFAPVSAETAARLAASLPSGRP
ncbi:MAG: hypothetical protein M3Z29_08540 [Pseudomonadota bacterium]|nr:hypothetical protein [Pseudomonadota bacterium]